MRHRGIHYVTAIAVTEGKYFRSFSGANAVVATPAWIWKSLEKRLGGSHNSAAFVPVAASIADRSPARLE